MSLFSLGCCLLLQGSGILLGPQEHVEKAGNESLGQLSSSSLLYLFILRDLRAELPHFESKFPLFFPPQILRQRLISPLRLCEAALRELSLHPAVTLLLLPQVDSGGPLVCSYWNTLKWFQVGITSSGKPNHRILTPVCSYQEWIEKETAIRGKPFLTEGVDNGAHLRVARSRAGTRVVFLEHCLFLFIFLIAAGLP